MSLTVGRAVLDDPAVIDRDGDRLALAGDIWTSGDLNLAIATRQQVLGLAETPDEQVFPLVSSEMPELDGFYYVRRAAVGTLPSTLQTGVAPYRLDLQRVGGGFRRPAFEVSSPLFVRSNTKGATAGECRGVALWTDLFTETTAPPAGATSNSAQCDDGSGVNVTVTRYSVAAPASVDGVRSNPPSRHYLGAATLEVQLGTTWYPLTGRQVPFGSSAWRVSNGMVRFSADSTAGRVLMERWRNDAWRTVAVWRFGAHVSSAFTDDNVRGWGASVDSALATVWAPIAVIRNSPEVVTLNWSRRDGARDSLTLRAGDYHGEFLRTGLASEAQAVQSVATIASEDIPNGTIWSGAPGRRASSDDGNGLRAVVCRVQSSWSAYTTPIGVYLSAAAVRVAWGLGAAVGATEAAEIAENYTAQNPWTMAVRTKG